jgi:hypothetical protein
LPFIHCIDDVYAEEEVMKHALRNTIAALARSAPVSVFAQRGPASIIGRAELSGTSATAGANFDKHDDNGDLDCESFLVKVVHRKQVVIATLPRVHPIQ